MCIELDAYVNSWLHQIGPAIDGFDGKGVFFYTWFHKKSVAAKVLLAEVGWNEIYAKCLQDTKDALSACVELSHPDPTQILCVFADASETHWGSVITQIPSTQTQREIEDQDHQPLMFLSGTFSNAALRWSICEKEAFSIVQTLIRADYLLHPANGFRLYTDH